MTRSPIELSWTAKNKSKNYDFFKFLWGAGQKGHRRELILPKSFIPANPPKSSGLQILLEIPNVTFKLSKSLESSQKTKKNYGMGGREPVSLLSFDLGKPNDPLIYQMNNLGSIFEQRCSNDLY